MTATPPIILGTGAGFGGAAVTVTVGAGTLAQTKRQARTGSHRLLKWPALRPAVDSVEVHG